jgi:hypothetical protein
MLIVHNETTEEKKTIRKLNQHLGRPKFSMSVVADFDKSARDGKIDDAYLKKIYPEFDDTQSDDLQSKQYLELPKDIKFKYMVRKNESGYNQISSILVHPNIAIKISIWMSPKFGYSLINSFKEQYSNVLIYTDATKNTIDLSFPKLEKNNIECVISDRIAEEEIGVREVFTSNNHRIDILTKKYIIEVKNYNARIKAIGQVFYYQSDYPGHKLWIHIFDHNGERDTSYAKTCEMNNIKLTYEL